MMDFIFIGFCLLTIGFALGVVFSRNAVYSAFNLVLCFFGLSAVYLLWNATFIAMIQILIYTGAIVVLFLFVVMLLDLVKSTVTPTIGWWTFRASGRCILTPYFDHSTARSRPPICTASR